MSIFALSHIQTRPPPPLTFVVQEKDKASCVGFSVSDVINLVSWSVSKVCLLTDLALSYLACLYCSQKFNIGS